VAGGTQTPSLEEGPVLAGLELSSSSPILKKIEITDNIPNR
jgi:hypothetical protein